MRKPKAKKLHGLVNSGIMFIGDPSYMAGDLSQSIDGGFTIPQDPLNPFKDFDAFKATLDYGDVNLELPGLLYSEGRGIAVQTHRFGGAYEVKKKVCKVTGKVLELKIIFRD